MTARQRLAVMGSTGSIGTQTLDIVRNYPDLFEVNTLSAKRNWRLLAEQAVEFAADSVVIADETLYTLLKEALKDQPIKVYAGVKALDQIVQSDEIDTVVMGLVGYSGLFPTIEALKRGKKIALANKECLAVAGELVMGLSAQYNAPIIPVDSEHSAIFQCLVGEHCQIEKIILTASGGPFIGHTADELRQVTVEDALNHPYWDMGDKVTIDSASLMNKGLEVMEARWLFGIDPKQIEVVLHPGSVIHSMVQFTDGAVKAQLGTPDMHIPIQYALTFPKRIAFDGDRIDFSNLGQLRFYPPDIVRFPNLQLAYDCLALGGNAGAILNAANEMAVEAFLKHEIRFTDIPVINRETLEKADRIASPTLEDYRETDRESRKLARTLIEKLN